MKLNRMFAGASILLFCTTTIFALPIKLSPADSVAAFKAAGFTLKDRQWRACDDSSASYTPGAIREVHDLNGDGRPEAVITEGSVMCYGNTGLGFSIVSKQADGSWKLMIRGTGIPTLLATKGVGGWPDIEIGGPGFCFPVMRWNGLKYVLQRYEYNGKACHPG